jgi:predicted transcriptional regulator
MKQLVISVKSSGEVLKDFKKALKRAGRKQIKEPHYEISFDNQKDFERFVKNIPILSAIIEFKPKSVYELAKMTDTDVSNLNKIILFLEEMGAIRLKDATINGRSVKTPIVEYEKIEFKLVA